MVPLNCDSVCGVGKNANPQLIHILNLFSVKHVYNYFFFSVKPMFPVVSVKWKRNNGKQS